MKIVFQYCDDCPSHDMALARLRKVMAEEQVESSIDIVKVETAEQAKQLEFVGSPTILINGLDISPIVGIPHYALTCRIYEWDEGRISPLPSSQMIRIALEKAKLSE